MKRKAFLIIFKGFSLKQIKICFFSEGESPSCVGDFLVLSSFFVRKNITINESFRVHMSGLQLHDCLKLAKKKKKKTVTSQIVD